MLGRIGRTTSEVEKGFRKIISWSKNRRDDSFKNDRNMSNQQSLHSMFLRQTLMSVSGLLKNIQIAKVINRQYVNAEITTACWFLCILTCHTMKFSPHLRFHYPGLRATELFGFQGGTRHLQLLWNTSKLRRIPLRLVTWWTQRMKLWTDFSDFFQYFIFLFFYFLFFQKIPIFLIFL